MIYESWPINSHFTCSHWNLVLLKPTWFRRLPDVGVMVSLFSTKFAISSRSPQMQPSPTLASMIIYMTRYIHPYTPCTKVSSELPNPTLFRWHQINQTLDPPKSSFNPFHHFYSKQG